MPRRLPKRSGHETIKTLSSFGFVKIRQKGSHVLLLKEAKDGKIGCVVPLHKELATGTLIGILRQTKVSREEFFKAYKR